MKRKSKKIGADDLVGPKCGCCGVPWTNHPGVVGTCWELQRVKKQLSATLRKLEAALAEIENLKEQV